MDERLESVAAAVQSEVAPSPSTQGDIDMQAGESSADSSVTAPAIAAVSSRAHPCHVALRWEGAPGPSTQGDTKSYTSSQVCGIAAALHSRLSQGKGILEQQ